MIVPCRSLSAASDAGGWERRGDEPNDLPAPAQSSNEQAAGAADSTDGQPATHAVRLGYYHKCFYTVWRQVYV